VATLRCTLKLRDGRIQLGYTPAFDPADRSVWLTAAPDAPAGTMFPLDRLRVVVLETLDLRPVPMPASVPSTSGTQWVRLTFPDGEALAGRLAFESEGLGLWIEPSLRGRARAFVPADAARIAPLDAPVEEEWAFLPPPPTVPPSRSSMTMPVQALAAVPPAATAARANAAPRPSPIAPSVTGVRDDSMPPPSRMRDSSESSPDSILRGASSSAEMFVRVPSEPNISGVSASNSGILREQTVGMMAPPTPVPSSSGAHPGDSTPTDAIPAVSASDLEAQHTQPIELPLVPPPVPSPVPTLPPSASSLSGPPSPSTTWPDGLLSGLPGGHADNTASVTTPDLPLPDLDKT
jgi:hypothetical protein